MCFSAKQLNVMQPSAVTKVWKGICYKLIALEKALQL